MKDYSSNQNRSWYDTPNPLLEGLPEYIELSDFRDRLAFHPLDGIDVNRLSFMERIAFLVGEKTPLEPTTQTLRTAMTWNGMLMMGLRVRNPVLPEARKHYWAVLDAVANETKLPSAPSSGMSTLVIKGPTGTGKSVTKQRFCLLYPQVIIHSKNEAAGWHHMRQLVYLDVMLSHDGSRGGFVLNILLQMDAILETNYAVDLPKRHKTVEKLAVAVIGKLVAHYTGILFIDEGQLRNLVESGQAELMQTFLLLLMNSGLPLVFVGNEKAFDWVRLSQDKSRLYMNPPEIFSPAGAVNYPGVEGDCAAIARGVMRFYVLKDPVVDPNQCRRLLQQYSGGIARYELILWCSAQREQLLAGRESVGPADLTRAYESGGFDELRPLADGFRFRKLELLINIPDVNVAFYAKEWGIPVMQNESISSKPGKEASVSSQTQESKSKKKMVSEKTKLKQEQARNASKSRKREEAANNLSEEDLRKQGLVNVHLKGFDATRTAAEQKRT